MLSFAPKIRIGNKLALVLGAFGLLSWLAVSQAYAFPTDAQNDQPVNFTADKLIHDDRTQTVTAIGNVELVQGQRILRADKMVYNLSTDTVSAIGNVTLLDTNGDVHFAEYVELTDNMKDGFVHGLYSTLSDGSRFTAVKAKRENASKITMTEARYTPCKPCEEHPEKEPIWQIKADEVVHDEEKQSVKYKNARLEIMGVPLAYTPVFSHPDPNVERKSGFLRPGIGWSSELGPNVRGGYYWNIAPDKDATLWVQPTTKQGILVEGEWRQRFENGRIEIDTGFVNSDRTEEDGRIEGDRNRGHIMVDGRFDLTNTWRAGLNVARASDKEYVRLYDIGVPDDNMLENRIYAERFAGRNYTLVQAMNFQDIRLGNRIDQPDIMPWIEHQMLGEPGQLLGGRWSLGLSTTGLHRSGDEQDMMRASMEAGWERRFISNTGLATSVSADARADVYDVQDRDAAKVDPSLDDRVTEARFLPTVSVVSSYPMVKDLTASQVVVEPIAGLMASPQLDRDDIDDIPNEDSLDIQLDTANLFDTNRFPGSDRVEDGTRVSYGINTGVYAHDGRYARIFAGQSYRFDDDNLFPQNSGLDDNRSDYVAQMSAGVGSAFQIDYTVKLNAEDLQPRLQEVRMSGGNNRFRLSSRYLYADAVGGTGFTESREQISLGGSYNINNQWRLAMTSLTDLGEQPGLRRASLGLHYADDCFTFSTIGVRNVASSASGEDETSLMMRVGLKNIGEFSTPEISLATGGNGED